jgi:hypothetical protein
VFDTLTEKLLITDEIGGEILQLIEQGKHLSKIVSELDETFHGDSQMNEDDVIEFIDQLKSNNIISV